MSTTTSKPRGNRSSTHLPSHTACLPSLCGAPKISEKNRASSRTRSFSAWADATAGTAMDVARRILAGICCVPNLSRWRKLEGTQPPAREPAGGSRPVTRHDARVTRDVTAGNAGRDGVTWLQPVTRRGSGAHSLALQLSSPRHNHFLASLLHLLCRSPSQRLHPRRCISTTTTITPVTPSRNRPQPQNSLGTKAPLLPTMSQPAFSSPTPAPGSRAIATNALRRAGLMDQDTKMRDMSSDKPGGRKGSTLKISKPRHPTHRPRGLETILGKSTPVLAQTVNTRCSSPFFSSVAPRKLP